MISVACLMATTPARDWCRDRSIHCFHKYEIPCDCWLVTLEREDSTDTLGTKLNRMIARSTADYFIIQDDDDYYPPARLRRQIEPLLQGYDYSGSSQLYYWDRVNDKGYMYKAPARFWLAGMAFTRKAWERLHFSDMTLGVDTEWQHKQQSIFKAKFFDVADPAIFIATAHEGNACPKAFHKKDKSPVKKEQLPVAWKPATLPEFPKL